MGNIDVSVFACQFASSKDLVFGKTYDNILQRTSLEEALQSQTKLSSVWAEIVKVRAMDAGSENISSSLDKLKCGTRPLQAAGSVCERRRMMFA